MSAAAPQSSPASGSPHRHLTRRERQIMEVLYQRGEASAAEVQAGLPDPPGYSAVRALLRLLEEKGHVRHRQAGRKYLFAPTLAPSRARRSALRSILSTFFGGSLESAVASLLDLRSGKLSGEELDRLSELIEKTRLIEKARKQGGK